MAVGAFYGEVLGASDSAYEGSHAGYVKIYQNIDNNFTQIGDVLSGDSLNGDEFGYSIDLSSDGSIVAVSSAQGGDVFVYKRTGDNWSQLGNTIEFNNYESDIKPVSRINKQERVTQVKLTNDGNYIAIGSPNSDVGSINTGKLQVFQNVNSSWVQVGSDIKGETLSHLGTYIDIEKDNNGFLTLAASGTKGSTDSYVNVYKLINSEWLSFGLIDSKDNQSFPTNSLDLSDDASVIAIGTSHSPINSSDYDENYISAGFIGYKDQTGNARIQGLSEGLVNSPTSLSISSTNNSKPIITGNSEPGNKIYLYNETILLGTAITNENGVFSITSSELNDGTYSLRALAKDSTGNVSSLSSSLSITIIPNKGKASFSIIGRSIVGNTIRIKELSPDPDGTGQLNYSWQISSNSNTWTEVSKEAEYLISNNDEGKSIRAVISYKDGQGVDEVVTTDIEEIPFVKDLAPKDLLEKREGGDNPEILDGTSSDDLIDGFGGNDTITGLAGDDFLLGGDGDDEIDGGSGTNRLYGDAGDDIITSSGSYDFVDGGEGDNKITITSTAVSGTYQSGSGDDIYNLQDGYCGFKLY